MTRILFFKLLRDVRWPLLLTGVLLLLFQLLWAKVTERITAELVPTFTGAFMVPLEKIREALFSKGPGRMIQAIMGGESINLADPTDMLSIGYVHPVTQAILCIWAVGRSAGALAGEIDRGTMELLLGQPIPRRVVVFAHWLVDLAAIPVLCGGMIAGTWLGVTLVDLETVEVGRFAGGLTGVAALLFAVGGLSIACSAAGRSRTRVLIFALGIILVQFLVNLIGQLWIEVVGPLRPYTIFNYYRAQNIILGHGGNPLGEWSSLAVLAGIGLAGYAAALVIFSRRDLPAPL